jgi:uncharacterized SAM-binding protein YcdF (DUF218 family)
VNVRLHIKRAAAVAGVITLLLLLTIHLTPMTQWWARALAGNWTDADGDILIVLAAEIESDGILGPSSYLRTEYAVRAYRQHPFRMVVVTGGLAPGAPRPMGDAMREFLVACGVPGDIIRVDDQAMSTRQNAERVKALLADTHGTAVLLTSDYHMFRAHAVFEKAGVDVVPRPIPDVLKRSNHIVNRWVSFWTLVVETAKIGYYAWKGWI